jgi:glycogen operon protein
MLPDLAARLTGSADLFDHQGRRPWSSVNFVAAHDGFTTADIVAYARKHNEANREDNRDGHDANFSANHGVEGPSADPAIGAVRLRQQRNLLATLLLSQGTPMLLGGDEFSRTQGGNNNAYCQDNEVSWLDWDQALKPEGRAQSAFVQRLTALRRRHPVLRRARFMHGRDAASDGIRDVAWFGPDGVEKSAEAWRDQSQRCLVLMLGGTAGTHLTPDGMPLAGATLLGVFNAGEAESLLILPRPLLRTRWRCVLDTAAADGYGGERIADGGSSLALPGRCILLFELMGGTPTEASGG